MIEDALSTVVSRHAGAQRYRCDVRGHNVNAWCRIPGSPFAEGLSLFPNHPTKAPLSVAYGPLELPAGIDALTCRFTVPAQPHHENALGVRVRVLDDSRVVAAQERVALRAGESLPVTLRYDAGGGPVIVVFEVAFTDFAGGPHYGSLHLNYALAYRFNPLVELFNRAGSDKGTEVSWGGAGVPHCYALTYETLFASFREASFNLLEIGLDTASRESGKPIDAPSLRVWREYFSRACLFGYDINDFGFLDLPDTTTFRGDQSSREDLEAFLEAHDRPRFRVILDDGSHASSHQQISLARLFPHLEPGGLYIIEDLHWQPWPESPTTLEMLNGFVQGSVLASPFLQPEEARALEAAIDSVVICRPNNAEVAVITKKGG